MEPARFFLENYHFTTVRLNLEGVAPESELNIHFIPTGVFHEKDSRFLLEFEFNAIDGDNGKEVVYIKCVAKYGFHNVNKFEDVPAFFYNNSIAILFPYIRAFVSTVTLQANVKPMLLPTLNLSSLQNELKEKTSVVRSND